MGNRMVQVQDGPWTGWDQGQYPTMVQVQDGPGPSAGPLLQVGYIAGLLAPCSKPASRLLAVSAGTTI